ncbi:MAG: heavy metal translocating P-type ATPase [Firmicutes bacterium]|nr:heavy metal translocating P-type ATPase [Bacillota bacterium]
MKFVIKHEIKKRIRIHIDRRISYSEADKLIYYIYTVKGVINVKVYERTSDVVISFTGGREEVIEGLKRFKFETADVPAYAAEVSGRKLNAEYREKIIEKVVFRYLMRVFIPAYVRAFYVGVKSMKYLSKGFRAFKKCNINVDVLDAAAVAVSVLRSDFKTAGATMFLLEIGELLEEWTRKKSVNDIARTMSLNIKNVWALKDGQEILTPADKIKAEDLVVAHMGNAIPFDGVVEAGEGMVNQSSMTGEPLSVYKSEGIYVYAGTVLEEGELIIRVKEINGASRFQKITAMIEESEKLKSNAEGRAEHLADRLVPYTLLGTFLVYAVTRNPMKALAVLMVDFSCALKLTTPISVLSAIREASLYNINIKGGKFLEAVAEADTIVFDKTGTLTRAKPQVTQVISFCEESEDELLRKAACMEEHFPHSMAKAVVNAAAEKGLIHDEMHSKVEYIVAHGISTTIKDKKIIIGSHHFVFEDEKVIVPSEMKYRFENLPSDCSHLYMASEGRLKAVICVKDPLREEAAAVINSLKKAGVGKVVMMTGDSDRTAREVARAVGVDEYYSEVLPEDKADYIEREKAQGRKVIMVGDGINDSPALSAADVGIAISDGAEIAREIADITIEADDLFEIVTLKAISNALMKRIYRNYRLIAGFNASLIVLGVSGIIKPTASALLHNTSTLAIGVKSMQNLL